MTLNPTISGVTDRIIKRSKPTRRRYLELMAEQNERGINRPRLSCGNFAHGFAAAAHDPAGSGRRRRDDERPIAQVRVLPFEQRMRRLC